MASRCRACAATLRGHSLRGALRAVVAPHASCAGLSVFAESVGVPDPGQARIGNKVTLEVTSALNLVSTTVSGYLKFAS